MRGEDGEEMQDGENKPETPPHAWRRPVTF